MKYIITYLCYIFFFQAEDGIRDSSVTGVQTCALPIYRGGRRRPRPRSTTQIDNASRLSTSHDDSRNRRITQKPRVSRGRSRRRPPRWLAALPYCIGRAIVDRGTSAGDQQ